MTNRIVSHRRCRMENAIAAVDRRFKAFEIKKIRFIQTQPLPRTFEFSQMPVLRILCNNKRKLLVINNPAQNREEFPTLISHWK